jgi:hypothetical protein
LGCGLIAFALLVEPLIFRRLTQTKSWPAGTGLALDRVQTGADQKSVYDIQILDS